MGSEKEQNLENKKFTYVKLKYVKLGYHYLISNAMYLFLIPLVLALAHLSAEDFVQLFHGLELGLVSGTLVRTSLTVCLVTLYFSWHPRDIYLVNFACFKPAPELMITSETFLRQSKIMGDLTNTFSEEVLEFQRKIIERSGYGQKTYAPKAAFENPPNPTMVKAREEVEMVMFGAIDELLNPTPSLSAMVVNRYKLRGNILSYSLGGMGCSAGMISIDLAKCLLQDEANTYALVVSTESITLN